MWHLDREALSLNEMCGTTLNRRPICLAVVDASLYRPEVQVKAETTAAAATVPGTPSSTRGRIATVGRVTIEKADDDTATASISSVFQATAHQKKAKKRKATVVEEEQQDDAPEEPPVGRKRITLLSSDKKKLKKSKASGFTETTITPPPAAAAKGKKTKRATPEEANDDANVMAKKSKKSKSRLQENI